MNGISFWHNWSKQYKTLIWVLLALLAGSILYFITLMWLGAGLVIGWENRAILEAVDVPLFRMQHPLLSLNLDTSTYVVRQTFWGTELRIAQWPAGLLLVAVAIGLSVALAVISSLRRFWYIAGMALFCGLVVSLRMEQLVLFGRIDKTSDIIIFLLFLPLSYFFQSLKPSVSLPARVLSFLGLFVIVAGLIYFFAEVNLPFLYIANYGMPVWLLLSFLLILLVAPEIIAAILYLVTATNTESSRNSFTHFVLASLIYFSNLFLYYLENRGVLDLGLYYISPFWVLLFSMLLAIWTLRSRAKNFANVLPWEPQGLLLYLALGIICMGTIAYVFATANDPLIETVEDAILYTHMGMGFFFFLYIIVNFIGLLEQNKRVFWVVYDPRLMPLFTARLAGVIALIGFYSLHGMYAIYKPMGGYYNGIGDLYQAESNYFLAEQYYKLGSQHRFSNHRSNYALASLAMKAGRPSQAMLYLKAGIERHPTPYAYANLANLYFDNNLYFDGLFTLREGLTYFPAEGRLYNNLGLQFGRTNVVDSALYYLDVARRDSDSHDAAVANELALLVQHRLPVAAERLGDRFADADLFYQNNLLSLYNQAGASEYAPTEVNPRVLQELGGVETAWLLNYALLKQEPDSALSARLQGLIEATPMSYYEEPAMLTLGILRYKEQNHYAAFRRLNELARGSVYNNALYFKLQGSWALEQEAPGLAAGFFRQAFELGDMEAGASLALALAEAGRPRQAAQAWLEIPDSLLSLPLQKSKAEALFLMGSRDFADYPGSRDEAAYKALRWQWGALGRQEREALINGMEDENWRRRALLLLAAVEMEKGSPELGEAYLERLHQGGRTRANSEGTMQYEQRLRQRLSLILQGQPLGSGTAIYPGRLGQLYASAVEAQLAGNNGAALAAYADIMQANPFAEEAYLAAVPLLNREGRENEAYDFLLNALQFNPYSVLIKEAYILQSLRLGLNEYAAEELQNLRELVQEERFIRFAEHYKELADEQAGRQQAW